MKIKHWLAMSLPLLCLLFAACDKSNDGSDENQNPETPELPDDPNEPQDPELPDEPVDYWVHYTQSQLAYSGDDGSTEVSDLWELTLYTDMEVEGGYPVGPGQVLRVSFNSRLSDEQTPELSNIVGYYVEQSSTGDFSPGTFLAGYMDRLNLPGGYVETPRWSFYGDIPAGTTEFDADLLREGRFEIRDNGDGTFTAEGILVGTEFRKRYFTYTGKFDPITYVEEQAANSTLTEDITIGESFTQSRLFDRGDSFKIGDWNPEWRTQYKTFEFYLAASGITLYESLYPFGYGDLLKLDLFVPYESNVEDGIPAGEYKIIKRTNGGLDPSTIIPFNAIEGYPNKFVGYEGAWFITLSDRGGWGDLYARIAGGTVKVERPNGAHRITFDLLDCSEPAYRITGEWYSEEPITVYSE